MDGFSSIDRTMALSGGAMYRPTISAALAANSGSLLTHQDLRPDRSIFFGAQEAPDVRLMDVAERPRQQRPGPVRVAGRRRLIEHGEDALLLRRAIPGRSAALAGLIQTGKPMPRVTNPPLRRRPSRAADPPSDRARGQAVSGQQNDPSPVAHADLALRRTRQRLKHRPFLWGQGNRGRARDGSHPKLESRLDLQR